MAKPIVVVNEENDFDIEHSEDSSYSNIDDNESENIPETKPEDDAKSGMASVIARILSKDTSKSSRVLLAKGKTSKEILKDIAERKRQRDEAENSDLKSKRPKESREKSNNFDKDSKRKAWEAMGRRIPSVLDNSKEVKLRKIATQGMVQLFRLVSSRQAQG